VRSTDETRWTPPAHERVQRRVFGLAPSGLVAAATLLTFAAAVVGLATGDVVVGALLLAASFLLGIVYVEQARRHGEASLERFAAAADHTRALAGLTGSTAGAWTRAGRDVARLRFEARRLGRERSRLQYALGGAAYAEDAARVQELRAELRRCMERIDGCAAAARAAVEGARRRTADERLAVAPTQIRKPGTSR
jgi:hypothetical protein